MSYIETNGYFTFDGVKSSTYGVWINGGGTYNAAARRYSEYKVPGRSGVLTIDEKAFEDCTHKYTAFIAASFPSNVEGFRNQLASRVGYCRLTDTYHTDEFYKAKFMDGLDVTTAPGGVAGAFDVKFKRDPRRFLTSGETVTEFTANGTISNPTLFKSKPLIRVYGNGTLTVGSQQITIASHTQNYIDIDSEIMDCYCGTTNMNSYVTLQNNTFPELAPGSNGVQLSGVTSVKITPRWYRL